MPPIRLRWNRLIIAGLLLCAAEAATFGNYVYTVPPGWTAQPQGQALVLTPQGLKPGEKVAVRLLSGAASPPNLGTWLAQQMKAYNAGSQLLSATPAQASTTDTGEEALAAVSVVQNGSGQEWRFFFAVRSGNRAELLVITTSSYQTFLAYQDRLDALDQAISFANAPKPGNPAAATGRAGTGGAGTGGTGTGGATPPASRPAASTAAPASPRPAPSTPAVSSTLPAVPVPNLPQLMQAGLNPERQPIPDEFRCYLSHNSSDYSRPTFALQILPGGRYRAPGGEGRYSMVQTNGGSLNYLRWQGGPLAGTDDAFLLFDRQYGQRIQLDDVGSGEDRLYCYQRGGAEQHALVGFRRNDPQVGVYPCRSLDGNNTDMGRLELLPGRGYRYGGGTGRYTVNILGKQRDSFSGVDFIGGPLDDTYSTYSEDELGEREFGRVLRNMRCAALAKPIVEPRFGTARAPAPPRGSGGLEGAYSSYVQNVYPNASLVHSFYIFKKDGYVFTGDPDTSLQDADCTRTRPSGLPVCEVYRLSNGTITIGQDKPQPWTRTATGYALGSQKLTPVRPVGALKLAGQYKSVSSFTAIGGTGGGLFESVITFRKDGTFSKTSSGGVSITTTTTGTAAGDVTGGVSSSSERRSSGRYSFAGNTLTLTYADGRTEKSFVYFPTNRSGGQPDLSWLYVGGSNYFLEDGK